MSNMSAIRYNAFRKKIFKRLEKKNKKGIPIKFNPQKFDSIYNEAKKVFETDKNKARKLYQKAAKLNPENPELLTKITGCIVRDLYFDQALLWYKDILEYFPNYDDAKVRYEIVEQAKAKHNLLTSNPFEYIHFLQCISCNTTEDLEPYLVEKRFKVVSRGAPVTTTTSGIGRVVLPVCNRCLNEFKRLGINLHNAVEFKPQPLVSRHKACIYKVDKSKFFFNYWVVRVILNFEAKAHNIEYSDI